MRGLLCFFLVLFLPCAASAEFDQKYAPIFVDPSDPSVFFLVGDIDARAALNLDRAIDEFGTPSVLVLSSDGGLVAQGLSIARSVHKNGMNTLVPSDAGCYSSCALVFLAGKMRVADGELGVHQISSESDSLASGQIAISDILDVLGDFNVPNELLVDMFRTSSDDMHTLSDEEKLSYGFSLRSSAERLADPGEPLENQVLDLILAYNAAWSSPNDVALPAIMSYYAEIVQFYGKTYSADEVLKEKREFADRWPIRQYSVDGSSVSVSCREELCVATGNVSWYANSIERGKTSRGVAYFETTVEFEQGVPRIVAENGKVISRS